MKLTCYNPNIRLDWKGWPETNTLAYLSTTSATKKKFNDTDARPSTTKATSYRPKRFSPTPKLGSTSRLAEMFRDLCYKTYPTVIMFHFVRLVRLSLAKLCASLPKRGNKRLNSWEKSIEEQVASNKLSLLLKIAPNWRLGWSNGSEFIAEV